MASPRAFSNQEVCLAHELLAGGPAIPIEALAARITPQMVKQCEADTDPKGAMEALARVVDGTALDQADLFHLMAHPKFLVNTLSASQSVIAVFFHLLAHPKFLVNGYAQGVLKEALDYPRESPPGVLVDYRAQPIGEGGQVAYVTITPEGELPKPPLVFITGLHHKVAVYLDMLVAIAQRDGRRVIAIDLPGIGGSRLAQGASVYASDLGNGVERVIAAEIPAGAAFDLMGHSLGTVAALMVEETLRKGSRPLGRVVLVAPVPSEEMRGDGNQLDGRFTRAAVFAAVTKGEICGLRPDFFFNGQEPDDAAWLTQVTGRECFSTSLWASLSVFLTQYFQSPMDRIGHDRNLVVVLPEVDQLMARRNYDEWVGRRGVLIVPNAGHSFLAGRINTPAHVEALLRALNDPLDVSLPVLDRGALYRRWEDTSAIGLAVSAGAVGGALRAGGGVGLLPIGPFGIDLGVGTEIFAGYPLNEHSAALRMGPYGELALRLRHLPIALVGGWQLVVAPPEPLAQTLYAGITSEVENAVTVRAVLSRSIDSADPTPAVHLLLGIPISP